MIALRRDWPPRWPQHLIWWWKWLWAKTYKPEEGM